MRRLLILCLSLCLLSGCAVLPQQTDAADELILRLVTLSRSEEGEVVLRAVTAEIRAGESDESPRTVEGRGKDFGEARRDLERKNKVSFTHTTDWVVEQNALPAALDAFVQDPDLTYSADIYLLKEQSARDFLDAFADKTPGAAKSMESLDLALGADGLNMITLSARLAAGESCAVPVVKAENGGVSVVEEVTVERWK